jgi:hypothetical protein
MGNIDSRVLKRSKVVSASLSNKSNEKPALRHDAALRRFNTYGPVKVLVSFFNLISRLLAQSNNCM